MAWIKWHAEYIAALEQIVFLSKLLAASFRVVAARAQRGEALEGRIRLAAVVDRDLVIDRHRGLDATEVQAGLA